MVEDRRSHDPYAPAPKVEEQTPEAKPERTTAPPFAPTDNVPKAPTKSAAPRKVAAAKKAPSKKVAARKAASGKSSS
jgi:hypothetical protein